MKMQMQLIIKLKKKWLMWKDKGVMKATFRRGHNYSWKKKENTDATFCKLTYSKTVGGLL